MIDEAVILVNQEGEVEFWSDGAAEMFGHHTHEVVGQSVDFIVSGRIPGCALPRLPAGNRSWLDSSRWDRIRCPCPMPKRHGGDLSRSNPPSQNRAQSNWRRGDVRAATG
jgi:hypothetical protein